MSHRYTLSTSYKALQGVIVEGAYRYLVAEMLGLHRESVSEPMLEQSKASTPAGLGMYLRAEGVKRSGDLVVCQPLRLLEVMRAIPTPNNVRHYRYALRNLYLLGPCYELAYLQWTLKQVRAFEEAVGPVGMSQARTVLAMGGCGALYDLCGVRGWAHRGERGSFALSPLGEVDAHNAKLKKVKS